MGATLKSKTQLPNTFLDFEPVFCAFGFKVLSKKVTSKTSLTNMSKIENSAYFCHVFADNFFLVPFQNFWLQMRRKRLKKTENLFYECVLESD